MSSWTPPNRRNILFAQSSITLETSEIISFLAHHITLNPSILSNNMLSDNASIVINVVVNMEDHAHDCKLILTDNGTYQKTT